MDDPERVFHWCWTLGYSELSPPRQSGRQASHHNGNAVVAREAVHKPKKLSMHEFEQLDMATSRN